MVIKSNIIKSICSRIAPALDSNSFAVVTEILQLTVSNKKFTVAVTNREYFVRGTFPVSVDDTFSATVKADLFIKLIDHITTEDILFEIDDTNLVVKGNGTYKLPLIYEGESLMKVPEIKIDNVTTSFSVSSDILRSINTYNSKELSKGTIFKPVQNMYYVDNKGAITFTSGACVNNFALEKPVSMVLNNKLVKLFNLFDAGVGVNFEYGCDVSSTKLLQNKVRFYTDTLEIVSIISNDDSLISSVPVSSIREKVSTEYPYSMTFNKNSLLQAIDRLSLFTDKNSAPYITISAQSKFAVLSDATKESVETVAFLNESSGVDSSYDFALDLNDFRITINNYVGQDITIRFGDKQSILVPNGNVKVILPEVEVDE